VAQAYNGREDRLAEAVAELSETCDELVGMATALSGIDRQDRLSGTGPSVGRHVLDVLTKTRRELSKLRCVVEARALENLIVLARLEVRRLHQVSRGSRLEYADFKTLSAQGASRDALEDLIRRPEAITHAQSYVDYGHRVIEPMLQRLLDETSAKYDDLAAATAEGNAMPDPSLLFELREYIVGLRDAQEPEHDHDDQDHDPHPVQ
jgi:hypothetical protein